MLSVFRGWREFVLCVVGGVLCLWSWCCWCFFCRVVCCWTVGGGVDWGVCELGVSVVVSMQTWRIRHHYSKKSRSSATWPESLIDSEYGNVSAHARLLALLGVINGTFARSTRATSYWSVAYCDGVVVWGYRSGGDPGPFIVWWVVVLTTRLWAAVGFGFGSCYNWAGARFLLEAVVKDCRQLWSFA